MGNKLLKPTQASSSDSTLKKQPYASFQDYRQYDQWYHQRQPRGLFVQVIIGLCGHLSL